MSWVLRSVLGLSYSPGSKTYHIVMVLPFRGGFSFSFQLIINLFIRTKNPFIHTNGQRGCNFMRWPHNPGPSGNGLTSWLPELLWVSGYIAFSSGHLERTSLLHRSGMFLGVMDQQPPPCKSSHYVQETWRHRSKWRQLVPGHQLFDKDPSHLKLLVLITIF